MAWSFSGHTPVYVQIADRIRDDILCGVYPPKSQIPSVRQLALTAAVNPNTVQHALAALETEGIICSEGTAGRFVTDDKALISAARHKAAQEFVRSFTQQAKKLSISKEELIKMIEEEDI